MTTIQERAAEKAGRATEHPTVAAPAVEQMQSGIVDMGEYEPGDGDPEMIPVHLAWLRVRRDVRAIGKGELYNGGGTRFNFRGVDTVVNCFGPVTLRHGVNVLPVNVEAEYRDTTSKANNKMHECTVRVTWLIVGPKGDTLTMQTQGEALDSADKATAKAQSVALRVLLLSGGLIPTSDPDPDSSYIERGDAPMKPLTVYRDEILEEEPGRARMVQIMAELRQQRRLGELVVNENGDEEPISAFVKRKGDERGFGGGS